MKELTFSVKALKEINETYKQMIQSHNEKIKSLDESIKQNEIRISKLKG